MPYHANLTCDFILQVMTHSYLAYILIPAYLLITVAKITLYATIFYRIYRRTHQVKKLHAGSTTLMYRHRLSKNDLALTKTGALVLVIFIVCTMPYFINLMLEVYGNQPPPDTDIISIMLFLLILLNSALNPFVYVVRLPHFRAELKLFFCTKRPSPHDNMQHRLSVPDSGKGLVWSVELLGQGYDIQAAEQNDSYPNRRISTGSLLSFQKEPLDALYKTVRGNYNPRLSRRYSDTTIASQSTTYKNSDCLPASISTKTLSRVVEARESITSDSDNGHCVTIEKEIVEKEIKKRNIQTTNM